MKRGRAGRQSVGEGVKMGRREMGIADENKKCGKVPERGREKWEIMQGRTEKERRRRQQGRRRVWLGEERNREVRSESTRALSRD